MERKVFAAGTAQLVAQGTVVKVSVDHGRVLITLSDLDGVHRTIVLADGEPVVWLEVTQFTDLRMDRT